MSAAKRLPQKVVEHKMAQQLDGSLACSTLPNRKGTIYRGSFGYMTIRNVSRVDESTMLDSEQAVALSTCEEVAL